LLLLLLLLLLNDTNISSFLPSLDGKV